MKHKMLTAVSAIAIMGFASSAMADNMVKVDAETKATIEAQKENNPETPDMPTVTEKDIERGWEKTKNTVSGAAEATGDAIEETYHDIKHAFSGDHDSADAHKTVSIKTRTTAQGMLGKDVHNADGDTVAKVEDIVLDLDGNAELIVLRDGGFFGMGGKLVAFDYNQMVKRADSGDMIIPVSEELLEKVAEFSYDRSKTGTNLRLIPTDGVSVAQIMDGHVQNNRSEDVADIDNLTFVNGEVEYLVISFNELLEMGGDTAVIEYDSLQIAPAEGEINMKLSASQSTDFEMFKKKVGEKS